MVGTTSAEKAWASYCASGSCVSSSASYMRPVWPGAMPPSEFCGVAGSSRAVKTNWFSPWCNHAAGMAMVFSSVEVCGTKVPSQSPASEIELGMEVEKAAVSVDGEFQEREPRRFVKHGDPAGDKRRAEARVSLNFRVNGCVRPPVTPFAGPGWKRYQSLSLLCPTTNSKSLFGFGVVDVLAAKLAGRAVEFADLPEGVVGGVRRGSEREGKKNSAYFVGEGYG